jgi:hypothetical protein
MKLLKIRLYALLIITLIISLGFLISRREKVVSGHVLDCATGRPIAGAEVHANQSGWGFGDYLVWDKPYISSAVTDDTGHFTMTYRVGDSANISAEKKGFLKALQYESPRSDAVIKLLQGNKAAEVTYNCKLSSECLVTTLENNVQVSRNVCFE